MSHPYSRIGYVGNVEVGLMLWLVGGGGVGYMPCIRDFDVCSICMRGHVWWGRWCKWGGML